jgi:hypothetical protein
MPRLKLVTTQRRNALAKLVDERQIDLSRPVAWETKLELARAGNYYLKEVEMALQDLRRERRIRVNRPDGCGRKR